MSTQTVPGARTGGERERSLTELAPLIELASVQKVYRTGKVAYRAVRGVELSIGAGEMVAVARSALRNSLRR